MQVVMIGDIGVALDNLPERGIVIEATKEELARISIPLYSEVEVKAADRAQKESGVGVDIMPSPDKPTEKRGYASHECPLGYVAPDCCTSILTNGNCGIKFVDHDTPSDSWVCPFDLPVPPQE